MLSVVLLSAAAITGGGTAIEVTAKFMPARRAGAPAAVELRFAPADPDVHVNRYPPPRLELEPLQGVLKLSPAPAAKPGPAAAKYLAPSEPYRFPVATTGAASGRHTVKGTVTYYYCSKREGWCRRGSADVEVPVKLR